MFDDETIGILNGLADAALPFDEWLSAKSYDPSKDDSWNGKPPDMPWRKPPGSLTIRDLEVVRFLKALIHDSAKTEHLLARWRQLSTDGLAFSPIGREQLLAWRHERGLAADTHFGAVAAQNVWPTGGALLSDAAHPLSQRQFYRRYIDPLKIVKAKRDPKDRTGWQVIVRELLDDECCDWPKDAPKSSLFAEQFVRDLLYALLGMVNPFAPSHLRDAVLIELGEKRRAGNVFTESLVAKMVESFWKKANYITATGDSR